MMLSVKIAWRYLRSKKAHSVVNIISAVSVCGVVVAATALVCVMSVFNGFAILIGSRLSQLDPEIAVAPSVGKTLAQADSLCQIVAEIPGVKTVAPVVQDNALAVFDQNQMPVLIKGVPHDYAAHSQVPQCLIDGEWLIDDPMSNYGVFTVGPAIQLGVRSGYIRMVNLYTPRRLGKVNIANPMNAFRRDSIFVAGVVQFGDNQIDTQLIFIPIALARKLLDYTHEATTLEVSLTPEANEKTVMSQIKTTLGDGVVVQNRLMQRAAEFKMVNIEKWVTFLLLAFILVIATFNVISALSLLIIDKQDAITTLRNLGADNSMITSVFVAQAWIISLLGAAVGIVLGLALSLAQEHFGLIAMSGDPATMVVSAYPVKVVFTDILSTFALVIVVGFFTSIITSLIVRSRLKNL